MSESALPTPRIRKKGGGGNTPPQSNMAPALPAETATSAVEPILNLKDKLQIFEWLINMLIKFIAAIVAIGVYVWGAYIYFRHYDSIPLASYQAFITFGYGYVMRHFFPVGKGIALPFGKGK